jgi:limonene-1,2-epoxide hydrolase
MSVSHQTQNWLNDLFTAIDAKDTAAFLTFLTDDALFRFGSAPGVRGAEAIGAAVSGFFQSIGSSRHRLINTLAADSILVCEGEVRYQRLDDREVTLPFANVFDLQGNLISDYKIYIDIAPLFAE